MNKLLITLAILGVMVPGLALAQGLTEYTLLEPIPGVTLPSGKATANSYLSGIFQLIVSMAVAFAVLRLIYAGITYMSTDAFSGKSQAKEIISETFWGLGFLLSAWLIAALILPENLKCPGDSGAFCFNLSLPTIKIETTTSTSGGGSSGGSPSNITQTQAIEALRLLRVEVNGPIVLAGIQQSTINELGRLKNSCGSSCVVKVTSATGGSHASGSCSHTNGYKVDLRSTGEGASLTNFIKSKYQKFPNRSDGAEMYKAPNGVFYALENDHWDVAVCR